MILLEGINNKKVLEILSQDADILVEQIIATGYALNAIEGMATEQQSFQILIIQYIQIF